MTEFDLDVWEKSGRDPVQVLSAAKVTSAGTGDDVSGLDALDSGELVVAVHLRRSSSSGAAPSMSVIVEESEDGSSWSTLETFSFTASGASSASVADPPAFLRARWTVAAGEWSVSVLLIPAEGNVPGAGGNGGSQPVEHRVIPVTFSDIVTLTGRAPILTLQPGEWLFVSWRVVAEAFNDTAVAANGTAVLVPAGASAGSESFDDALSTQDVSTANAVAGLIGPDPASALSSFVNAMVPLVSPATVAVAIELDFCADNPATGDGTTGALEQHLLILSAP